MDIYPKMVKELFTGPMDLNSFNLGLRALIEQTGKFVHIGFEFHSTIRPYNYKVGNPQWYRGLGWYIDNTILIFHIYEAFLLDRDRVTEIEIDGIKLWYTDDGYAHYENVRSSQ
ncbi:MAG: hypothetical protein PHD87_01415 [Candidatus Cloacimonetes bacterium]|nr:hypothetical protein [Candidatus Cloacimonadota bacterium]